MARTKYKIKIPRITIEDKRNFYYELFYIYKNWSPLMRRAFGCTKAHVKTVLKKFEKYTVNDSRYRRAISNLY